MEGHSSGAPALIWAVAPKEGAAGGQWLCRLPRGTTKGLLTLPKAEGWLAAEVDSFRTLPAMSKTARWAPS